MRNANADINEARRAFKAAHPAALSDLVGAVEQVRACGLGSDPAAVEGAIDGARAALSALKALHKSVQ